MLKKEIVSVCVLNLPKRPEQKFQEAANPHVRAARKNKCATAECAAIPKPTPVVMKATQVLAIPRKSCSAAMKWNFPGKPEPKLALIASRELSSPWVGGVDNFMLPLLLGHAHCQPPCCARKAPFANSYRTRQFW